MNNPEWKVEETVWHTPSAVLYDGTKIIVKIYLSPDYTKLRIVLPEMESQEQIKFNGSQKFIDFMRKA